MGKAGRVACIFTPMALTIASFVCIVLINLGGINKNSDTLNNMYFFDADFSNFTGGSSDKLGQVIQLAKQENLIADFYQIHMWNYCNGTESKASSGNSSKKVDWCSARKTGFWFDPNTVWNLNAAANQTADAAADAGVDSNTISQFTSYIKDNYDDLQDKVLDESTQKAILLYAKVSKWMFAAYFAGLWFLLATCLMGVLAVFSRVGGFCCWILAICSTILVFGASITSTVMFSTLVATLHEKLKDYGVKVSISTHMMSVTWLATAFILLATLFWLFSACCCSGKSNPHHRSNKDAPAQDLGFFGGVSKSVRGRGTKVEKTGAGYERVESPGAAGHAMGRLPPQYAQETGYKHVGEPQSPVWNPDAQPYGGHNQGAYEPYRRNY